MKTPRLTRDQAIAKIAELENELTIRKESSQTMREELSKALGAGTYKENTYSTPEQVVYSWYKIMLELGKVLAERITRTSRIRFVS